MRRRTLIIVGCLELFALLLANWQALAGVRTDEAKYLLSIPYPHPPLLRWIFSLTDSLLFHEMLWRILLASLLVQGVWFVWDMCRDFRMDDRVTACAGWLLASALLTQAGSVMLAPMAALQALAWLWLRQRPELARRWPLFAGLFWTATVFSSFQGVLFAPLAWSAFRRGGMNRNKAAAYVLGPVVLLALWALSNPLALATIIIHKNEGVRQTIIERFKGLASLWTIGGGLIGSILGTWGIVRHGDRMLQASFVLVCAYVLVSIPYPFYAILFTPLFVGGLFAFFRHKKHGRHPTESWIHGFPFLAALVIGSAVITWFARIPTDASTARLTMKEIETYGSDIRLILINGAFGHQWQFETYAAVQRYSAKNAFGADAIICLDDCIPMFNTRGWKLLTDSPVQAWVKDKDEP